MSHAQNRLAIRLVMVSLLLVSAATSNWAAPASQVSEHYTLPGEGGWDFLTYDTQGQRLFIARSDRVQVINPATGLLLGEINNTAGVHGVALAQDLGLGFTSNGRSNTVSVFNLKTLKVQTEIAIQGVNPDVILYVPEVHRVYAFNGRSHDISVIDAHSLKPVNLISLKGRPEFAVSDGHNLYFNLEDTAQLVTMDLKTEHITRTIDLAHCEEPTGLALNPKLGHLFSVCSNGVMVVVEALSGKILSHVPVGKEPDAAIFDSYTGNIYSSSRLGTLSVVAQDKPNHYALTTNVPTHMGARTMALDTTLHQLFLVAADFEPAPAATPEQPNPHPKQTPGTTQLLVVHTTP